MSDSDNTYSLDGIFAKIEQAIDKNEERIASLPERAAKEHIENVSYGLPVIGMTERHGADVAIYGEEWQAAYERAKVFAEQGGLIVAYGGRGRGKTQMAFHLAKHANFPNREFPPCYKKSFIPEIKTRPAIYLKAMEIFIDSKHSFSRKDAPTVKEILQKLEDAAFLILDEAQVRGETKFEDDMLTHIIDKRYDACRATMLITNLPRKEFAATLSPSIISRIEEIGCGIECNWASYRSKK